MIFVLNILVSASVISFAAFLSGRHPASAGFVVALPLATMLVLPLSFLQHGNEANTVLMAKSILVAIPISLSFFLPFLLAERLALSFWSAYFFGCLALPIAFFVHRALTSWLFSAGVS